MRAKMNAVSEAPSNAHAPEDEPALDQGCMPYELYELALSQQDVTGTDIFGDYLVRPITQDEPGAMRIVQVMDAKNLVIIFKGRFVKKQPATQPVFVWPAYVPMSR